ncbi:MAG TPA: hypothetical protein VGE52_13075 [Pirellulales bacterium]
MDELLNEAADARAEAAWLRRELRNSRDERRRLVAARRRLSDDVKEASLATWDLIATSHARCFASKRRCAPIEW